MSGRPVDWFPLTVFGNDPLPGDWELMQEAAARYRETADSIQRARTLLGEVTSDDGWQSGAGEAFREKATELSDDVFQAHGRYDAAADALAAYWPELRDAQEESLDLRRQAQQVQAEIDRLGPRVETAEAEDSDTHDQHASLQGQMDDAVAELTRLRNRLAELIEDKNAAAQRAADAIADFISSDGLEDSTWDRMGAAWDAFQQVFAFIGELAGQIAMIAGIASLLLCWVPVLGQALAVIATIATAISLVANVIQGEWKAALVDAIGLATFGLGRIAGAAARAAKARGLGSAVRSTTRSLGQGLNSAQRLQRIRNLSGMKPGELRGLNQALHKADEISSVAGRQLNIFGRSISPGALGWARHAFRDLGSEFARALRAPFRESWSVVGIREGLGLTSMGAATSAAAGSAGAAASRAAAFEMGSVLGATGLGFVTLDDNWMPDLNIPDAIPFTDLPGLSYSMESPWSQEAADVGDFSYRESEAIIQ
jgi:hypothetical protein